VKLWLTCGAARYTLFPAWFALIVQVPGEISEAVVPETVQT
jgi:hypothetical protein